MRVLIISVVLAAIANAASLLAPRDNKPAKIGRTVEILVTNGTKYIGCVNAYGNFTRDDMYCALFQSFYTTGVNSYLWSSGDYCHNEAGALNCNNYPNKDGAPQFYSTKALITLDGPTGANFSIPTFPNKTDSLGVPLLFGFVGKSANVTLHWRSKQG